MNKFELTPDMLSKAAQCETIEDIMAKAREYNENITPEQAQRVFELSHSNAVSDEELDNVAGGMLSNSTLARDPKTTGPISFRSTP